MIGELHTFGGESIDVGCLKIGLPITREISVPRIVQQDVNDVGLGSVQCRACQQKQEGTSESTDHELGFSRPRSFVSEILGRTIVVH